MALKGLLFQMKQMKEAEAAEELHSDQESAKNSETNESPPNGMTTPPNGLKIKKTNKG